MCWHLCVALSHLLLPLYALPSELQSISCSLIYAFCSMATLLQDKKLEEEKETYREYKFDDQYSFAVPFDNDRAETSHIVGCALACSTTKKFPNPNGGVLLFLLACFVVRSAVM